DFRARAVRGVASELGWTGVELWVEMPHISAQTYHFEVEAPAGLDIYDARLVATSSRALRDPQRRDRRPMLARAAGARPRVHLYVAEASRTGRAFASLRLRVRRSEF